MLIFNFYSHETIQFNLNSVLLQIAKSGSLPAANLRFIVDGLLARNAAQPTKFHSAATNNQRSCCRIRRRCLAKNKTTRRLRTKKVI